MILQHKNGYETYYETYGDENNPAIVLLHGIGADHTMWEPQKNFFSFADFFVITPDLLAHGKSSKVKTLSLLDWVVQLEDLLDHLDIHKVTLIGMSMGGVIAQFFAVTSPDRLERLVVSDSFGELKTLVEKFLGFSQVLGFRIFKLLGNQILSKGMASSYKADYAIFAKDYFQKVSLTVDLNQMVLARKAINKINVLEKLKSIKVPALVLVGSEFGKSFVAINKKIAVALRAKLVVIPNSMDPSNLVNPVAFNQIVLSFLSD